MSAPTILDLLQVGDDGDTSLNLRLTARELAAIQYVLTLGQDNGLFTLAYLGAGAHECAERWATAFQSAELRIGIALARVFGDPARVAEFSAELALVDQDQTALDNGEESL